MVLDTSIIIAASIFLLVVGFAAGGIMAVLLLDVSDRIKPKHVETPSTGMRSAHLLCPKKIP
jgi:hypothetical protein